ncbi:universal stress protein [Plantibacter flavus]|uniref:universal stress protein n=1 Tax=Plantibacter flavus TaxID=150123 RepID=UPI003F185BB0
MTSHTVIGWDGLGASRHAANWATDRAALTGEPVRIVQVIAPGHSASDDETLVRAVESTEDEAIRLRNEHPGLQIRADVFVGDALRELEALSGEDVLIAVGTDELGTASRTSGWSLGTRLAASCSGPVAVIPRLDSAERHGIVLAIEGDETDDAATDLAAREAIARQETLHLVHAWHQPVTRGAKGLNPEFIAWLAETHEQALTDAARRVAEAFPEVSLQQHLSTGTPAEALHAFAASASALVVGTRGHGAVLRFILGSTSHDLLLYIDAPTIVVPRQQRDAAEGAEATASRRDRTIV